MLQRTSYLGIEIASEICSLLANSFKVIALSQVSLDSLLVSSACFAPLLVCMLDVTLFLASTCGSGFFSNFVPGFLSAIFGIKGSSRSGV